MLPGQLFSLNAKSVAFVDCPCGQVFLEREMSKRKNTWATL